MSAKICVRKLPRNTSANQLKQYFAKERIFGDGVRVDDVQLNGSEATITFYDEAGMNRVLQRHARDPCKLFNSRLEIEPVSSSQSQTSPYAVKTEVKQDDMQDNETDTIEVLGFDVEKVTEELLENYFENQFKAGGGEIVNISLMKDFAQIKFKDRAVVKSVVQKSHTLSGCRLSVKPLIISRNTLLVANLPDSISEDTLENYFEAKLQIQTSLCTFNQDKSSAMVAFKNDVDFEEAKRICQCSPLLKVYLSLQPVPVTSSIVVTNLPSNVSGEAVQLYFENKNKSNGGEVEYVETDTEHGYCLVHFKQVEDMKSVCAKQDHMMSGTRLQVKAYHRCLGLPFSGVQTKLTIPDPIEMNEQLSIILSTIARKDKQKDEIIGKLVNLHAEISDWTANPLSVSCTLSESVADSHSLAKSWQSQVKQMLQEYTNWLEMKRRHVSTEIWRLARDSVGSLDVDHPERTSVLCEKDELMLIAPCQDINKIWDKISTAIQNTEEAVKRQNEAVTEVKYLKKSWEGDYLKVVNFPDDIQNKFQGMTVHVDRDKVTFVGAKTDVTQAVLQMYELCNNAASSSANIPEKGLKLLNKQHPYGRLVQRVKEKRVAAVLEVTAHCVTIRGKDESSLQDTQDILDGFIADFYLSLNKDKLPIFKTSKWQMHLDEMKRKYKDCIEIDVCKDSMRLEVCSLADYEHEIKVKMDEFLKTNVSLTQYVNFKDINKTKYLDRFHKQEIKREVEKCRSAPKYHFEGSKVAISGTEEDLGQLRRYFEEICDRVINRKYNIKVIGIQKYLASTAGKDCLINLERLKQCVIVVNGGNGSRQPKEARGPRFDSHSTPTAGDSTEYTVHGKVTIRVAKGDLTKQKVDVIAVSASKNLQFRGRLHALITEKGGPDIEDDCRKRIHDKGNIREGNVYLGTAGDLPCQAIAHTVIAAWDKRNHDSVTLENVIENCLRKCDKQRYSSIAFPGLGTGQLHYPTDIACKTIVLTICHYVEQNSDTRVKEVVLCDMNSDTLNSFEDCLAQKFGGHQRSAEDVNERRRYSSGRDRPRWRDQSPESPRASDGMKIGRVHIKTVAGFLAKEKVDVIVNSAPRDLHLKKGKCSSALLEAGGYRIQQDCKDNYPKGIKPGQVAVTTGGKLSCKKIFHISLQSYSREDHEETVQGLRTSIVACLEEASDQGFGSIAIPSAGTGSMKFPSHVVAQEMFTCVQKYFRRNPRSSLTLVHFVIFPEDRETVKAFRDEERKSCGHSNDDDVEVVYNRSRGDHGDNSFEVQCQGAKIVLVKAHLTKEKVDVIVNSTAQDLKLDKGQSSKAILQAAGAGIQTECQQQYPDGITAGQVAFTSPGNLKCKKLFHIALQPFQKENGEESMQNLAASIEQCLIEGDKQGFKTMSIPPIGTGALKHPKGWVAGKTFSCISKYFQSRTSNSLSTIRIVVFPGDDEIFQAFKKEAFKRTPDRGGDSSSQYRTKEDTIAAFMSKEKNTCVLTIYSDSSEKIKDAKSKFDATVSNEWCSKNISDEAISSLGFGKLKEIKEELKKNNIFAHINKDNGCIIAYGLAKDLLTVSDKLDEILKKQRKYLSTKNEAKLVKNVIKWSYQVKDKTIPFGDIDNLNIEKAYQNKDNQVQVKNRSGQIFIIDFQNMNSYDSSKPGTKTQVFRRDIMSDASGSVPSCWTKGNPSDTVTLVPLAQGSAEYTKVLNEFSKSLGRNPNIIKIERVQNKTLYIQYDAKLKSIDLQNKSTNNVKVLWHGTSAQIIPSIYTHGFNRSYSGSCSIGNGVYFAVNASYSDGGYARPDAQGHKRMFRCLVITGHSTQGQGGLRVAPQRTTVGNTPIPYDSVTDSPGSPSMFVIFHDCQAYPEHLITYI